MKFAKKQWLLGALAAFWGVGLSAFAHADRLYPVEQRIGILYGTGSVTSAEGVPGTKALTLDAYVPRGDKRRDKPAIMVIHGGAFAGGKPRDLEGVARYFAERGFAAFSISYRLLGDNPPGDRLAAYADARSAVRWVRAHAKEFGIDPGRIAAIGHSAGAIIALQIAVSDADESLSDGPVLAPANHPEQSSAVQAAVALSGVFPQPEVLDAHDPPILFVHGANDPIIPFDRGKASRDLYLKAGAPCRLVAVAGVGHDPWNERYQGFDARPEIVKFVRESLQAAKGPLPPADGELLAMAAASRIADLSDAAPLPTDPAKSFTLDVSGAAHGSVTLDPPGGAYPAGTAVKLTPVPDKHYAFLGWAGDTREISAPATIHMLGSRKVTALFAPANDAPRHALTLEKSKRGEVVPTPDWSAFVEGGVVTMKAVPKPGARFVKWTGDLAGADNPAQIAMDNSKRVGAVFESTLTAKNVIASAKGGTKRLPVQTSSGAWQGTQAFARPWLAIEPASDALVARLQPNPTSYSRWSLVRVASDQPGVAPVYASITQKGLTARAHATPKPGVAVFTGKPGETGLLRWVSTVNQPQYGMLEANDHGGFAVGSYRGSALGYATVDGKKPLLLPDGRDYHVYAEWDLPENPEAITDPETGAAQPAYFYVGIDSGGFDFTKFRFGIEWKDMGQGKEWVVRVQRDTDQMSAAKANGGHIPQRIRVHVWKDCNGDTAVKAGGSVVRGQFRLDDGPWQDYRFSDARTITYYPLAGMGQDAGDDYVTFKVRGLGTANLRAIRVEGEAVPGVNGE